MLPDDITITNIKDTPNRLLQVTFFVRGMSEGVITAQAVADAVQVCILSTNSVIWYLDIPFTNIYEYSADSYVQ